MEIVMAVGAADPHMSKNNFTMAIAAQGVTVQTFQNKARARVVEFVDFFIDLPGLFRMTHRTTDLQGAMRIGHLGLGSGPANCPAKKNQKNEPG